MEPQSDERRQCTRTPFLATVLISTDLEHLEIKADLRDISISGMYVELEQNISVGTVCSSRIIIEGKHSRLILDDIQGEVVREEEGGVAIRFASNMEWFVLFKIYTQFSKNALSG